MEGAAGKPDRFGSHRAFVREQWRVIQACGHSAALLWLTLWDFEREGLVSRVGLSKLAECMYGPKELTRHGVHPDATNVAKLVKKLKGAGFLEIRQEGRRGGAEDCAVYRLITPTPVVAITTDQWSGLPRTSGNDNHGSVVAITTHQKDSEKTEREQGAPAPLERNRQKTKDTSEEKTERKPQSSHREAVAFFCDSWSKRYGCNYPFARGKDAAAVRDILQRLDGNLSTFKAVVARYFADADPWLNAKARHSLGILLSQLPKWIVGPQAPEPWRPKTAADVPALSFSDAPPMEYEEKPSPVAPEPARRRVEPMEDREARAKRNAEFIGANPKRDAAPADVEPRPALGI